MRLVLAQAQQQTLGNLLAASRQQGLEEVSTLGDVGTKMLTGGIGIGELEQKLIGLGIDAETARSAAAANAGQIGTTALADIMKLKAGAGQQKADATGQLFNLAFK